MGIPGLKRVIEAFYPSSVRVNEVKYNEKTSTNIILIDGNIALYSLKDTTLDITPELLLEFCEKVAIEYHASEKIIVFDGMPPIQKLPEQIKRRKKRYANLSELNSQLTFDLINKYFIQFLEASEKLFASNDWVVKSYLVNGEGEQKIANIIRSSIKKLRKQKMNNESYGDVNFIAWTKDWDMFIILLNIDILSDTSRDSKINIFLHMNLMTSSYLVSMKKCQRFLYEEDITPLHFMSIMLLFGSDFYPGLNNISLTTLSDHSCILRLVMRLIRMKPYILEYIDEETNQTFLELSEKRLLKVLDLIRSFHSHRLSDRHSDRHSDLNDNYNSSNSTSSNESDKSNKGNRDNNENSSNRVFKFVSYSNIDTKIISIKQTECQRDCILCRPNRYSTREDITTSAREYIKLYLWTIYYFKGLLKNHVVHNTSTVYTSYITPSVKAIIRVLKEEDVEHNNFKIDITHKDSYTKAIESGLLLEYSILPPCQFIKMYNDDVNIFSHDLSTLDVFQ